MTKRAAKLVPKGLTIARVAIEHDVAWQILGDPRRRSSVLSGTVSKTLATAASSAIRSNVEFLTSTAWK